MLVAIAGRKHSGKTTICQILMDKGFKRASFAAGLKEYLGKLYNWSAEDLDTQHGKESLLEKPVLWNLESCLRLSQIIGVNLSFDKEVKFLTRRDALQYIGTEILRRHDPDFHLKEFKKRFSEGKFVCDDVRFSNELELLNGMNAVCCYVVRPYYWCYSNHSSEIDLNYKLFTYYFLNDGSLRRFKRKTKMFFENIIVQNETIDKPRIFPNRETLIQCLENNGYDTSLCAKQVGCSRDVVVWWATKYCVHISRNSYHLNHEAFSIPNFENAYWAGVLSADGTIKKHLTYNYLLEFTNLDKDFVYSFKNFLKCDKKVYESIQKTNGKSKFQFTVSSSYLIDDLKKWNLEPKKSRFNKIPDCLRNDDNLFSQWLVGLIDGDGCIHYIKNQGNIVNICVQILASKQIIDYVVKFLNLSGGSVASEKGIENLFTYRVVGKNAFELYKKIYKGQGLQRKWGKFSELEKMYPEKFR